MSQRYRRYHEDLFAWHCRTFFPFERDLADEELGYLDCCFGFAKTYQERPDWGYDDLSYYSYSHQVAGDTVNSSRIAFGSIHRADEALHAAQPVLNRRGIALDPSYLRDDSCVFYGLGWDIAREQFKIYFRVRDVHTLPDPELRPLVGPANGMRNEGLVSLTFVEDSIFERKVYLYPARNGSVPEEFATTMRSTLRGTVEQVDVRDVGSWLSRINDTGQGIVRQYTEYGESLDTITYEDRDHYTLYFP